MHIEDVEAVAEIHTQAFPRQENSWKWINSNFAAFPRIMIFVARDEKDKIVGYIQWIHKSGFRKDAVMELEQIAVLKPNQGKGIATQLIQESLIDVKNYLDDNKSTLKFILISTRTDNKAQELYKKILGAQVISIIQDLYSADEVLMLAKGL
jgi:ribosomal protein S18 acetylase RimI-like enzyme